ncbi:MAG: excinuclease ABC subunit UvrA [Bdellovibrionales bacterium]|nr:excinuclease ABC subunit UvrA [Bdellovibrionales bacterium]
MKQNNLKGVDIEIPIGSFTVVCGPSGSGKSSLAFETLYAEGQRRYIESLSSYSRQFLNKAPKPDLEGIENIPPAISIEQKNSVKSSRSTVGTTTELIDYLRLLFEKIGHAYCPDHKLELHVDSPSSGAVRILENFPGERGYVLVRVPEKDRVVNEKRLLALLKSEGFRRIYVGKKTQRKLEWKEGQPYATVEMGEVLDLDDPIFTKKGVPKSEFFIVIDRLVFSTDDQGRIADSLAQAYHASMKYSKAYTAAQAEVLTVDGKRLLLSEDNSCSVCAFKFPLITSALFSFNSPVGACPDCNGFGNKLDLDPSKVIPNPELSIGQGAIAPFAMPSAAYDRKALRAFCKKMKIDQDAPWAKLPEKQRQLIWKGNDDFYGVKGLFEYLETKKYKMHVRVFISRFKSPFTCPTCNGSRLKPEALQVLIRSHSIATLGHMTIEELYAFVQGIQLSEYEQTICAEPFRQIRERLRFLNDVGVGYLTVDRPTKTLSGGEFQRLQLANQLGMGLSRTLYVLDEPTVGLHPRDTDRLIGILKRLRELGNTLVVVEHDHDVILNATDVIEMGPGSGHLGGEVIYKGEAKAFLKAPQSKTAEYLRPSPSWVPLREPRPVDLNEHKYVLSFKGVKGHNLKNVNIDIPLNRLVTVTGVSGSGKSTLVAKTIYPVVARHLGVEFLPSMEYKSVKGLDQIKAVVLIDQSAIGKTARSNPLTYLKVFDSVRSIMASSSEAKARGYTAGTFSLNVDGGRCPVCKGLGYEMVDMLFMDDIEIKCDACDGKRYRPEILEITYKGKNIDDVLNMTVAEAMDFFVAYPNVRRPLSVLKEVGLDYLKLGQSANTLSGGESQRMKLARELAGSHQQRTLYILDEPTTGLHFREVHLLLKVLNRLVEAGSTVLLVEHNLEIIKHSDYVIDLGPEAGDKGGQIMAEGTPQELMKKAAKSHTGRFLKAYVEQLGGGSPAATRRAPASSAESKA